MNLRHLNKLAENLPSQDAMPVLFIGHGSPMNGIEANSFSQKWVELGKTIPQPKAVVCISAHWLTKGSFVTAEQYPKTIHDFSGFPKELYEIQYPAPGDPALAKDISEITKHTAVGESHEWGFDHGAWTVLRRMYPEANIPIIQLSIDYYKPGDYHHSLAQELSSLRKKGILFVGSGNMVHNLPMIDFEKLNVPGYGYDWALESNEILKEKIFEADHASLMRYDKLGKAVALAVPTPDHYWPLIYTLGLREKNEPVEIFNDQVLGGSITMTSVKFG